ncbi:CC-NBS-LRR resistance protein [Trifolium pratense]|uniref:CC-NBS-LRR resistance protein n=1 Tax=Trifolium pratense TaxID=57577 RepID=A0A2K3LJD2_TRIPR|nr:CC-NBS-LRR resistance protein [Trifolium pratense]PNX90029.1 CC-NBS-LRR resistance protein [Trifolium pratense]
MDEEGIPRSLPPAFLMDAVLKKEHPDDTVKPQITDEEGISRSLPPAFLTDADWKKEHRIIFEDGSSCTLPSAYWMDEEGRPRSLQPSYFMDACFSYAAVKGDDYIPDDTVKQQIMDALSDQGKNIIGLCGPDKRVQHSAKTTIRRAERDGLFLKIVTATVTNKPDITKIQTQIGDVIGLHFDDKTDVAKSTRWKFGNKKRITTAERATLLCAKMKELQTVLVVLYDVHGKLDLGEIGIPFGDDHNGCKILLTSTSVEVLSEQMKVHKLIEISET